MSDGAEGSAGGSKRGGLPESPLCPFCEESDTELVNPFGPQLSVSSYWCLRCRSPFEMMKWQGSDRPALRE